MLSPAIWGSINYFNLTNGAEAISDHERYEFKVIIVPCFL
jgi:hypothetical protein